MFELRWQLPHRLLLLVSVAGVCSADHDSNEWCLPSRYNPVNFSVQQGVPNSEAKTLTDTKPQILLNNVPFEVKGVGYSPIPPGKNTLLEVFDYFTDDRSFIWKRDIPVIASMGANVIRTWSWDATKDHTGFLDYCNDHGLSVLVPFLMTTAEYPKLADPSTIHQVLIDFKAFVNRVKNHPALFGYMIGNELNEEFAGQLDELFSLVNTMVEIRDSIDPALHPITVPFSDSQFIDELVVKYYPWLKIDFWSLQIYRDADNIEKISEEYTKLFLKADPNPPPLTPVGPNDAIFQYLPTKPLVFTEYGLDALLEMKCDSWNKTCTLKDLNLITNHNRDIPTNDTKQAEGFCTRFASIHKATAEVDDQDALRYVSGGVVMEYCDEWWKGTFPDVRRAGCPNQRTDIHTYCSQNINKHNNGTAYFLHEEWLGIFAQIPALSSDTDLIQQMDYCLEPRLAFCVLSKSFQNPEDTCKDVYQMCADDVSWQHHRCASRKQMSNNIILVWIVPPIAVFCAVFYILLVKVGRSWRELCATLLPPFMGFFRDEDDTAILDEVQSIAPTQDRLSIATANNVRDGGVLDDDDEDDEYGADEKSSLVRTHNSTMSAGVHSRTRAVSPSQFSQGSNCANRQVHAPLRDERASSLVERTNADIVASTLSELRVRVSGAFWYFTASPSQKRHFDAWGTGAFGPAHTTSLAHFLTVELPKQLTCPHFAVSQRRLVHMISDVFQRYCFNLSNTEQQARESLRDAIRIVHEKYCEGYFLYMGKEAVPVPDREDMHCFDMLKRLALYMIIQQWSGTINHSPEKICELLDWAEKYFAVGEPDENTKSLDSESSEERRQACDTLWMRRILRISGFHHGTVEIARTYCMKVDKENYSFDDINTDSMYRIKRIVQNSSKTHISRLIDDTITTAHEDLLKESYEFYSSKEYIMGTEGDLLPLKADIEKRVSTIHGTHLEYNRAARQENCVLSDYGRKFFNGRFSKEGENFQLDQSEEPLKFFPKDIAFPQRGGVISLIVNYQWLIRYLLWQNLIAAYVQPLGVPECSQWFFLNRLAVLDSGFCLLCTTFHYVTLRRFKRRLLIEFWCYLIFFVLIIFTISTNSFLQFVCEYFDGGCDKNKGPVVNIGAGVTVDVATTYLVISFLWAAGDEARLLSHLQISQVHKLSGRFRNLNFARKVMFVRLAYIIPTAISLGTGGVLMFADLYKFSVWDWWPTMDSWIVLAAMGLLPCLTGWVVSNKIIARGNMASHIKSESSYILANLIFWTCYFVLNWLLAYHILIPSVDNVDFDICGCTEGSMALTQSQLEVCEEKIQLMCNVAVVFVWISAYLVSFVFLFASYEVLLLVFGVARGKYIRVGNVQNWHDAGENWYSILCNSLKNISRAYRDDSEDSTNAVRGEKGLNSAQAFAWNSFVDAMEGDYLLSSAEGSALRVEFSNGSNDDDKKFTPNFGMKPQSSEAQRRVVTYLWGLESLSAHEGNRENSDVCVDDQKLHFTPEANKTHRVACMPSLTTLIPVYNEPVLYNSDMLKVTRPKGTSSKRISEIEYLTLVYTAEWANFAAKMATKHKGKWCQDSEENVGTDLLNAFMGPNFSPFPFKEGQDAEIISEIEFWATNCGQTLARTIKGLSNTREGLLQLCMVEEYDLLTPVQIMELISSKYQMLISHQTFNPQNIGKKTKKGEHTVQENAVLQTFQREKYFELVTNDDTQFQSHSWVLRKQLIYPALPSEHKGCENKVQSSLEDCAKVIKAMEKEQDVQIGAQFDILNRWHRDPTRTTPFPVGALVRVNFNGRVKEEHFGRKTSHELPYYAQHSVCAGQWVEAVVVACKEVPSTGRRMQLRTSAISTKVNFVASPSDGADRQQAAALVLQDVTAGTCRGVYINADRGNCFGDTNLAGWTITRVSVTPEDGPDSEDKTTLKGITELLKRDVMVDISLRKFGRWGDYDLAQYEVELEDSHVDIHSMGIDAERVREHNGKTIIIGVNTEYIQPFPFHALTVQRVSPLRIGEGKAENQIHALPFAKGQVIQAMDMNQYATSEQGMKIPFLLNDYFAIPGKHLMQSVADRWDHSLLIPPFRIVGFPEHCFTRALSMVGELMGAAEWCFVTINQRVLNWPLRIRMHYGHPDFFDGYWVRTRGGTSKASPKVNTNEDIFAGYEMLARGERGSYVEFMEVQKGRETAFKNAYVFESKLAQGAAQQIRSYDLYTLNRKLDIFQRFSLFYGSIAFYMTNFIMSISINYYILSIVLFSMSGVTYHQLGLLDAIIAIPWLFQIGYVLAIPMVVELIVQKGLLTGIGEFLTTLPVAIIFFIFHMRTKTYYFGKGLLVGAGGYASTGRGFGLDRSDPKEMYQTYAESHFKEALIIFICLTLYAIHGSDPILPYLARTFTIILICISWLWSPILFNPMTTTHEIHHGFKNMIEWLKTSSRDTTREEVDAMEAGLEAVRCKRALQLENNLTEEENEQGALGSPSHPSFTGSQGRGEEEEEDGTSAAGASPARAVTPDPESDRNQQLTLLVDTKLRQWYKTITAVRDAPFSTKFKSSKRDMLAKDSDRTKELILTFDTPASHAAFAEDRCRRMLINQFLNGSNDTIDVRWLQIEDTNVYIMRCTDQATPTSLMNIYRQICDASGCICFTFAGQDITVKVESFVTWAKWRVPTYDSLDQMITQYWLTEGRRERTEASWKAWYLRRVVFDIWMLEDEHAQSLSMRVVSIVIKSYLHIEFFLPWLLIALAYFNMESMWLLFMMLFVWYLFVFIDSNTKDRHDYPQSIKALTLLMLPMAIIYYQYAVITAKELFWSCIAFFIGSCSLISVYVGLMNSVAWFQKKQVKETSSRRVSDGYEAGRQQRRDDVTRANEQEKEAARLFLQRVLIPSTDVSLVIGVPFMIMCLMVIGNVLAAAMSTWITAMMYNGTVAEAWKKAYFQSAPHTPSDSGDKGGNGGAIQAIPSSAPRTNAQMTCLDAVNVSAGTALRGSIPKLSSISSSSIPTLQDDIRRRLGEDKADL